VTDDIDAATSLTLRPAGAPREEAGQLACDRHRDVGRWFVFFRQASKAATAEAPQPPDAFTIRLRPRDFGQPCIEFDEDIGD